MENAQKNPQAMQEALLETLNRLARINEVEGFDPRLLVACYKNESGEENLYLPAEPAMLWFRLKYPHGRLEQVATRVTDSMATVEGRVFDENGAMLANAFVTRYLAEAVKNNTMERRRAKALEDQKASGAKYPAPMFTSMGGTTAQRSKTGQCVFRQVSLVPGMKTDYALQVVEADGEPTATGGISMKKGAQVTRITVGLKREELLSMASAILMAWQAYMIASSAYGTLGAKSYADVQDADVPDAAANRQMPVKVVTTTASTAWVVYDSLGETFEVAVSHDAAILCVQESITFLRKTEQCYSRKDNNEYNAVKTAIQTDCDELPSITLYGKDNTTCEVIVVKRTIRKSPQEAQLPSGQAS